MRVKGTRVRSGFSSREPTLSRTHESAEPLEGSGNANGRVDLDEDALGGVDVDLQPAGLVEGRVEECQEALCRGPSPSVSCTGASYDERRTWWVMSGLACAMSLPIFASTPWWSSQFNRLYFSSPLPPRAPGGALCLYVSRHACSRTTINLRVESLSALVFGALGAVGTMVGFKGGDPGAGRLREGFGAGGFSIGMADDPGLDDGTKVGAETDRVDAAPFLPASPEGVAAVFAIARELGGAGEGGCARS